jgi:phage shock protein A
MSQQWGERASTALQLYNDEGQAIQCLEAQTSCDLLAEQLEAVKRQQKDVIAGLRENLQRLEFRRAHVTHEVQALLARKQAAEALLELERQRERMVQEFDKSREVSQVKRDIEDTEALALARAEVELLSNPVEIPFRPSL